MTSPPFHTSHTSRGTPTRRQWLGLTLAAATAGTALAQTEAFPTKPVTLLVPYGAGGPTDQHLRALAEVAGQHLGQPVVLDNRPGANGTNAAAALVRAAADGYTLAILPASVYREPFINKVPYDPATTFSYLLLLSDYTFGLAVPAGAPWKTWADFVADAKRRPGKINVGAAGAIGTPRIVMDEIAAAAGIELNMVPYKGDADITAALLGGHLDAAPLSGVAMPHIESGKLRYLVMLTEKPLATEARTPTLVDSGIPLWIDSPYGLAAPRGLPPERAQRLHDAFKKALDSAPSQKVMAQLNQRANYLGPIEYRAYAIQTLAREKTRVARLRERGQLD